VTALLRRLLSLALALLVVGGVLGGVGVGVGERDAWAGLPMGTGCQGSVCNNSHAITNVNAEPFAFIDKSPLAWAVTNTGVAQNAVTVRFGSFSFGMDATDKLEVPDNAIWNFAANFYFSGWFYIQNNFTNLFGKSVGAGNRSWVIYHSGATNNLIVNFYNAADVTFINFTTAGGLLTLNAWHYVEVFRIGSTCYARIDGTVAGSDATSAGTVQDSATGPALGGTGAGTPGKADAWYMMTGGFWTTRYMTPPNRRQ